jgi:hypothetical protein
MTPRALCGNRLLQFAPLLKQIFSLNFVGVAVGHWTTHSSHAA